MVQQRKLLPYAFLAPSMLAMIVLVFYPLVNGILFSFTDANQYNVVKRIGANVVPASYSFIGLKNYIDLFNQTTGEFWRVLAQTVVWTVINVALHVSIGLFLAILLNRKIRGRTLYRVLLIVPWAVPTFVSAFAWRFIFNQDIGFVNLTLARIGIGPVPWFSTQFLAMTVAIIANTWLGIPFNMVSLLGGLQSIPSDLYEAANVDGASWLQSFRYVTLPQLQPVLTTIILLGTIWTFNGFTIIFLITGGGPAELTEILSTYAWRWGFQRWEFGIAAAYSVVILLILLAFAAFYIRYLNRTQAGAL
jgi:arabinogalactan oligomer/maltooligosaccharide transport system permease protein